MFVIERYKMCELEYWCGTDSRRDSRWTKRFDRAVKFADHESGMIVLVDLCDGNGRVVEHSYVDKSAA